MFGLKSTYLSIRMQMLWEELTQKMINNFVSHMKNLTFNLFSVIKKTDKINIMRYSGSI